MTARVALPADLHGPSGAVAFTALLRAHRLPVPEPEYRFAPPRKWRFDYAWVERRVALEIEGGVWKHGRHTRGVGYIKDLIKYNEASTRGWTVIRVTPEMLLRAETVAWITEAIRRWRAAP